ncbi:MAG: DUF2231 domain-containing protein [Armatimonadetes bacterium]|nr:DUF2231 domain-containing protein [Armatimonadota bacterium]
MKRYLIPIALATAGASGIAYAHSDAPARFVECKAVVFGHPLHSMLVAFPIGLFVTSLLFDLMHLWRKDPFWSRAAYCLILVGLAGGVAAAASGFIDYFLALPAGSEAHEVAETHWLIMVPVLILFAINAVLRWKMGKPSRNAQLLIVGLSLAAITTMMAGAWYGGHLVYEHRVGVAAMEHHHEHEHHD